MLKTTDVAKFEEIYRKYNNLIFRIAKKILKNTDKIEDCVQKSYEVILRNLDKIDEINSLSTKRYICQIISSSALHIIRDDKRYVLDGNAENLMKDPGVSVENFTLLEENLKNLNKGFQSLNAEEKKLLEYRTKERLPYRKIALKLNLSETACRKRMQRVREQLLRYLL